MFQVALLNDDPPEYYGSSLPNNRVRVRLQVYIETQTASLSIEEFNTSDTTVPFDVWHDRTQEFYSEPVAGYVEIDWADIEQLQNDLAQPVQALIDQMELHWNGSNYIGRPKDYENTSLDDLRADIEAIFTDLTFEGQPTWITDTKVMDVESFLCDEVPFGQRDDLPATLAELEESLLGDYILIGNQEEYSQVLQYFSEKD